MRKAKVAGQGDGSQLSLCCLRAGEGWYGIDTRQIREVLGKTIAQRVPLAPQFIAGVVPYRGEVLTTVSFRALLGMEPWTGTTCVLVLDDENEERFGLMVDGVGGVVTFAMDLLEANPSGLDARSATLFDGAFRLDSGGLIVRLDPRSLRPSRLSESGFFTGGVQEKRADGGWAR